MVFLPRLRVPNFNNWLEWSRTTTDGSLSDLDQAPSPNLWSQVCSERGLCSPNHAALNRTSRRRIRRVFSKGSSADSLGRCAGSQPYPFFTLLNTVDEPGQGGVLFKNDFVVFDEAHTMEQVASRHIGLSLSSGQVSFALNKLWNPRSQKGLLSLLKKGKMVQQVSEARGASNEFLKKSNRPVNRSTRIRA